MCIRDSCSIEEAAIPIHDAVRSGCDVLGLDPLYLANEGKMLCFVPEAKAQAALDVLRRARATGSAFAALPELPDPAFVLPQAVSSSAAAMAQLQRARWF